MKRWLLAVVLVVAACGSSSPSVAVRSTLSPSSSPAASSSPSTPASPTLSADRSPSPTPSSPAVTCTSTPQATHTLALLHEYAPNPKVDVLDLADPLRPVLQCTVTNVDVAQFTSPTKLAIGFGTRLAVADLAARSISYTGTLPAGAGGVVFSPDGSNYAYGTYSDTAGSTEYLVVRGATHKLYTEPPIGGHGGPPWGPVFSQAFSPDGKYFLDYTLFRPQQSGIALTHVFGIDGSRAFDAATGEFPLWASTGSRLFYLSASQAGALQGDLHSWDPAHGDVIVKRGVSSYFSPSIAPDASSIVYDAYDAGSLPRLWQLNLATGATSQISKAITSDTAFVRQTVVWVDEDRQCDCGLGGNSTQDGNVLAYDVTTGSESRVAFPISMQGPVVGQIVQVLMA